MRRRQAYAARTAETELAKINLQAAVKETAVPEKTPEKQPVLRPPRRTTKTKVTTAPV